MSNKDSVIEKYFQQFRSGNEIPVERATITREELHKFIDAFMYVCFDMMENKDDYKTRSY